MRRFLAGFLAAALCTAAMAQDEKPKPEKAAAEGAKSVLDFTMKDIDGKPVELSKYKSKVLLVVNVASKCGYTPQYEQLQSVYDKYSKDGLEVLGFPANDFGHQEPGSDAEIKQFCTSKFNVTFPMFSKIVVTGDDQADLYKFLTSKETGGEFAGPIKWNFTKFLVDRSGKVIARFESKVRPDDPKVIEAIEKALKEKKSDD